MAARQTAAETWRFPAALIHYYPGFKAGFEESFRPGRGFIPTRETGNQLYGIRKSGQTDKEQKSFDDDLPGIYGYFNGEREEF